MSQLVVTASVLRLREGPGTNHRILLQLPRGEMLDGAGGAAANGWRKVRARRHDGAVTGWVHGDYVRDAIVATPIETAAIDAPAWYRVATKEIGVKEYAGPQHNPRIVEYASHTSYAAKADEIAWCSSFVNWCMAQARLKGTGSAAARSWLQWGVALEEPVPGCVTVFSRGADPAQGHVAFFVSRTDKTINVLGGNQSNQVKIAPYKAANHLAYRWPKDLPVPSARPS